jgi:hypothetical protein
MSEMTNQTVGQDRLEYQIPGLPLAVYREVAAHIRQEIGVQADLMGQTSQEFDYFQSQVGGLWIEYPPEISQTDRQRVEQILHYYGDRFGEWQVCRSRRERS